MKLNIEPHFFFRYGNVWTDWRETTSNVDAGTEETLQLDSLIQSTKDISGISGYSYDSTGDTYSLQAEIPPAVWSLGLTKSSWGPHGDHTPSRGRSLRSSPDAPKNGLRLNHISGGSGGKIILR